MVDIIVRAKNNHVLTADCLRSIRRNTPTHSYRLILSDDGSDPSLGDSFTDVYIRSRFSHGAVTATNQGLGVALNLFDNAYALILDNDLTIPDGDRGWLVRMVEDLASSGPETACVGLPLEAGRSELYFTGHCVLFHKAVLASIGCFDEQFNPGPYADEDYAVRLRLNGYSLGVTESVVIHHIGDQTHIEGKDKYLADNLRKFAAKWTPEEISRVSKEPACLR